VLLLAFLASAETNDIDTAESDPVQGKIARATAKTPQTRRPLEASPPGGRHTTARSAAQRPRRTSTRTRSLRRRGRRRAGSRDSRSRRTAAADGRSSCQ
jgi:hypothetical protein